MTESRSGQSPFSLIWKLKMSPENVWKLMKLVFLFSGTDQIHLGTTFPACHFNLLFASLPWLTLLQPCWLAFSSWASQAPSRSCCQDNARAAPSAWTALPRNLCQASFLSAFYKSMKTLPLQKVLPYYLLLWPGFFSISAWLLLSWFLL